MEPVYTPVIALARGLIKAMDWQVRVSGSGHIPRSGGAVIATNHVGYLDFVFVGFGARPAGRLVRFMAKKEVFDHRISGPLMRGMKHLPVDRYGKPTEALDLAIDALRRGEVVGMFPEGTISRSFVPRAGKTGAARMAMGAGVPLIPGAVWGSQRLLTKGRPRNLQRHVAITVDFGPPIPYEPDDDPADVTRRLMDTITRLVEVAQTSYPQQPAGDHDRWWLPAHLGGTAPTVEEVERMENEERIQRRAARRAARKAAEEAARRAADGASRGVDQPEATT